MDDMYIEEMTEDGVYEFLGFLTLQEQSALETQNVWQGQTRIDCAPYGVLQHR
jgi:hypothetical protein